MSDQKLTPEEVQALELPTLKSKIGLELTVKGYGQTDPRRGPTLRVERTNDGGVRDYLVSDLKRLNSPKVVNQICEALGEPPSPPQPQQKEES